MTYVDTTDLAGTGATQGANMVGFKQSGTGADARKVQDKLEEFVSVRDFGAIGDGIANDRAAIREAIDAANGRAVFFPTPSVAYLIGSSLGDIPANTRLVGENRTLAVIRRGFDGGYMANLLDGVQLENLTFDGNARTGGIVQLPIVAGYGQGNQRVSACRFINAVGGHPIYFDAVASPNPAQPRSQDVAGSRSHWSNIEAWRSDSVPGVVNDYYAVVHKDVGHATAGHPITMIDLQTGGYESIDFGGCNDLFLFGGSVFGCRFSDYTRGVHVGQSRWAASTGYTIKGSADFSGVGFGSAVTIAAGAFAQFPGCTFNAGWVDNSGANGDCSITDPVAKFYTPVFKQGSTQLTNATAAGSWHRTGNIIHVNARCTITGGVGGANAITVSLPFPASSVSGLNIVSNFSGYLVSSGGADIYQLQGLLAAGSDQLYLLASKGNAADGNPAALGNGSSIQISGTYPV